MTAHFWTAVVAAALLQVAVSPAQSAPQGISVYSSIDEKGQQHTAVVPLNQHQSAALAQQNLAQLNQQQSAISSLFGGLLGGNLFGIGAQPHVAPVAQPHVAPVAQPHVAPVAQPHVTPVKQPHHVEKVAAPPPSPPAAPASKTPCAGCGVR